MRNLIVTFVLSAAAALPQYKWEPAGPPPAEAPPAVAAVLQKEGVKVVTSRGTWCAIWLVAAAPSGPKSNDSAVDLPTIPEGAFLGVIQFPEKGEDRRGQGLKPGLYTLRYALHPVNGDHQGVAPQRDFAVLSPIAEDQDPSQRPGFEELMKSSRKASGTPHPAVLSIWQSRHEKQPDVVREEDAGWVVHLKLGETPLAMIIYGRAEG